MMETFGATPDVMSQGLRALGMQANPHRPEARIVAQNERQVHPPPPPPDRHIERHEYFPEARAHFLGNDLPEESAYELNRPTAYEETNAIELPPHPVPFIPKGFAQKAMENIRFHGMDRESPHEHIEDFLQACRYLRTPNVSDDIIRLTMFPMTLFDHA